jgi:hypothetical protein
LEARRLGSLIAFQLASIPALYVFVKPLKPEF